MLLSHIHVPLCLSSSSSSSLPLKVHGNMSLGEDFINTYIHTYIHTWPLPWFLAQSSQNPYNFLGDKSVFCFNKVTLDFWMRAGHLKDQVLIRSLELSALSPIGLRRKRSRRAELATYGASAKIPQVCCSGSSWAGEHIQVPERATRPEKAWKLRAPPRILCAPNLSIQMLVSIPPHILLQ